MFENSKDPEVLPVPPAEEVSVVEPVASVPVEETPAPKPIIQTAVYPTPKVETPNPRGDAHARRFQGQNGPNENRPKHLDGVVL